MRDRDVKTKTKIKKSDVDEQYYIYEIEISPNQHEAFVKEWTENRRFMGQSPLEYPFEEYVDSDIINTHYRELALPNSKEDDRKFVTDIMKQNPGASNREILEKVQIAEEKMIEDIIKEYEEGKRKL